MARLSDGDGSMSDCAVTMSYYLKRLTCGVYLVGVILLMLLLTLLLNLLHSDRALLVFASFVLEPNADDARGEVRHLHQLLLHQRIGARVRCVAGSKRVELLFIQHCANPCRFGIFV